MARKREAKDVKKVSIKLLKGHTHAGKECNAGEVITVSDDQAAWLIKAKVGALAAPETYKGGGN
jgi:hypothetical protein